MRRHARRRSRGKACARRDRVGPRVRAARDRQRRSGRSRRSRTRSRPRDGGSTESDGCRWRGAAETKRRRQVRCTSRVTVAERSDRVNDRIRPPAASLNAAGFDASISGTSTQECVAAAKRHTGEFSSAVRVRPVPRRAPGRCRRARPGVPRLRPGAGPGRRHQGVPPRPHPRTGARPRRPTSAGCRRSRFEHPSIIAPLAAGLGRLDRVPRPGVLRRRVGRRRAEAVRSGARARRDAADRPARRRARLCRGGGRASRRAPPARHPGGAPRSAAAGLGVVEALERVGCARAACAGRTPRPSARPAARRPRPADVFSLACVAFELLTGRRPSLSGEAVTVETDGHPGGRRRAALAEVFARALSAAARRPLPGPRSRSPPP